MAQAHPNHPRWPAKRYRAYLLALARARVATWQQAKVDPSDVVQVTLLKAHAKRDQFRGHTEAEWRGWLRQILARVLADAFRRQAPEATLRAAIEESASRFEALLPSIQSTPSQKLQQEERLLRLAEALAQLNDDERTALELRYLTEPPWPLADIARRLDRPTAKAVAGLLARGLGEASRANGGA